MWLTTCNSSSRGLTPLTSTGTCTHVHIPTCRYTRLHIIKNKIFFFLNVQAWWCMPIIAALRRRKQEASLGYRARYHIKTKQDKSWGCSSLSICTRSRVQSSTPYKMGVLEHTCNSSTREVEARGLVLVHYHPHSELQVILGYMRSSL